jgi:uncharacterized membrane protein YfcA
MLEILGLVALGLFAGALAATLGVGGGIIFVPVLVSVFGFGQLEAQGTSLAIIVPTTLIATIAHARGGRVMWRVVAVVATGGVFAAIAGANLAQSMDEAVLRQIFAVVLVILAVRMGLRTYNLWRAFRESGAVDTR